MSDKDLLVVISEMLRKQDQQAEILKENHETLKNFVDVSVQQFQQRQRFNELFLEKLDLVGQRISEKFDRQDEFNKQVMAQTERQNEINARLLAKLDEISGKS